MKLSDNRTNNPKKVCERYERHNKSFKSSGNKNREYKPKKRINDYYNIFLF